MMCLSVSWTRFSFLTDLCLGSSPRSAHLPVYFVIAGNGKSLCCILFTSFLIGHWKLSGGVSYHPTAYVIPVQDSYPSPNLHMLDCLNVNTECIDPTRYLSTCLTSSSWAVFLYFNEAYHMLEVRHSLQHLTGLSSWGWEMNHLRRATLGKTKAQLRQQGCLTPSQAAVFFTARSGRLHLLWAATRDGSWVFL